MTAVVWYISKYAAPPYAARVGVRGFYLMRELVKVGVKSVLITSDSNHLARPPAFDGPFHTEVIDGVLVIWLRTKKYAKTNSLARILSWIDFEIRIWLMRKSDIAPPTTVIASSLSLLTILSGVWLRRKYRCKLIFEVRDIWPLTLTIDDPQRSRGVAYHVLQCVERYAYQKADLIVGTMPNLKEHVRLVTDRAAPVVCIPQGIDPTSLVENQKLDSEFLDRYIPKNKFVVCHAGSIGVANALDTILQCAHRLKGNPKIHFLFVGDGDLKEKHQWQTAELPNVTFAPPIAKALVQDLLRHCDLVYFSMRKAKLYDYGQSLNKIIDYMLSGTPILASYSGFRSMINEAECGAFVPAEDCIALEREILAFASTNPIELQEMGARGRRWILSHRDFSVLAREYGRYIV